MTFGSRPGSQTLELGVEVDGQVLKAGRYKVSAGGNTLTVTNKGSGSKGSFEVVMVLERIVPGTLLTVRLTRPNPSSPMLKRGRR